MTTSSRPTSLYRRFGKRALDLAIAGPAALALAPLIGGLAVAVRATMGAPMLFRQARPGLHGRPFFIAKFRTMTDARDAQGELLDDAARLTTLGALMRRLSLDELPQLACVIRGDMSLVGPRPLLMRYLDRYSHEQARRHDVKPGITGQAQVSGRNALGWAEKLAHDVWYVDHVSFLVDMRILARTVLAVLDHRGIAADGHATMPEFAGAPSDVRAAAA